jgi:long-chain acyl-CoA synthetase
MAYHFVVSILLYLKSGACIMMPADHRPQTLARAIERDHATVIYANEHFFRTLLSDRDSGGLGSVSKCFSTSVSLSEKTGRDFHEAFGVPIRQAYGIIEVGLPAVNTDRPLEKAKSVGRLLPDYEVKILDDEGRSVPPDETGEILLRGPGFFDAYLSPFRTRDEVCDDGWFATGDLGRVDGQGYLYLCGRRKSVINCMGMKVFPEEVETVLDSHPYVRKALVEGRSHPYLLEVPHAIIAIHDKGKRLGTEEMVAFCSRHLSPHCIPRSFEFVDSLPETDTGKIRRG